MKAKQIYEYTIPMKAYYAVTLPDGKEEVLLLNIGETYTVEAIRMIAEEQDSARLSDQKEE